MLFAKVAAIFSLLATTTICDISSQQPLGEKWVGWGGNIFNNRWSSQNTELNSSSIQTLTQQCHLIYPRGVSATPTVGENAVYYPTWNGLLVALDYRNCSVLWQINVTSLINAYAPITPLQTQELSPVSRTSPQILGDVLIFGTQTHALLVAANIHTGKVLSAIQINPHPLAAITQGATVYNGVILAGASSFEELGILLPDYKCCSFIGNMAGLVFDPHRSEFNVLWNISMIPASMTGWSGAAIWGGQPSIDPYRNQAFIGTGNVYQAPTQYWECEANRTTKTGADPCLPKDIWQESILAIDVLTGHVNWVKQITALDDYTVACGVPGLTQFNPVTCPQGPQGSDSDFGMAPSFIPGAPGSTPGGQDIIVVGQKNGILRALSASTGQALWATQTSPGGPAGGLSWGIAVDATQAYFTAINFLKTPWTPFGSSQNITWSGFGAASLLTGELVWETGASYQSSAYSPPSVVGDVVLVARSNNVSVTSGGLVALDRKTGEVLLDRDVDATLHGGIGVQDGYVLFGTGYGQGTEATAGLGSFNVLKVARKYKF